jgi:hypothetical protein
MMPFQGLETLTTLVSDPAAASSGITPGNWLAAGVGIVVGVGSGLLIFMIARWQRRIEVIDRSALRAEQAQAQRRADEQHERIVHREVWRSEYEEIGRVLSLGDDIVYRIRHDGPFGAAGVRRLKVDEFAMKAEQLAGRGVEVLSAPLQKIADLARDIERQVVPEDSALLAAYARPARVPAPEGMRLGALCRTAVLQDRSALELDGEIRTARQLLKEEWGS